MPRTLAPRYFVVILAPEQVALDVLAGILNVLDSTLHHRGGERHVIRVGGWHLGVVVIFGEAWHYWPFRSYHANHARQASTARHGPAALIRTASIPIDHLRAHCVRETCGRSVQTSQRDEERMSRTSPAKRGDTRSRPPAWGSHFSQFLRLKSYLYFKQFVKPDSFIFVIVAEALAFGRSPHTCPRSRPRSASSGARPCGPSVAHR